MSRMPKYKAGGYILFQTDSMDEVGEFLIRYVYARSDGEIIYTINNEEFGNIEVNELEIDKQNPAQLI